MPSGLRVRQSLVSRGRDSFFRAGSERVGSVRIILAGRRGFALYKSVALIQGQRGGNHVFACRLSRCPQLSLSLLVSLF